MFVFDITYTLSWTDGTAIVIANDEKEAVDLVKDHIKKDNIEVQSAFEAINCLNYVVEHMVPVDKPTVVSIMTDC